jgi:hypothetical protein
MEESRMMGFSFPRVCAIAALIAAPVTAQTRDYPPDMTADYGKGQEASRSNPRSGAGPFSLRTGIGFTSSPTAFMFGVEGDYEVAKQFSLGANVQVGLDDEVTIVSPTAFARYRFDLGQLDEQLAPLEPSVRAGIGFSYWDKDLAFARSDDDTVFLFNLGTGLEYRFSPHFALGTLMHFNIMPTGMFDHKDYEDQFYFAWEVLTLRYTF